MVGSHLAWTGEGAVACEELEQASGAFTRVEAALPNEHRIWRGGARRTTIGTRAQVCQSNEAMKLLVLGTRNRIVLPTRTTATASHSHASTEGRPPACCAKGTPRYCSRLTATADESHLSHRFVRPVGFRTIGAGRWLGCGWYHLSAQSIRSALYWVSVEVRFGLQVAMTNMNACSSRSHAIFTINVRHHTKGEELVRSSTLHLVDLAGSVMPGPALRGASWRKEGETAREPVSAASVTPTPILNDGPRSRTVLGSGCT